MRWTPAQLAAHKSGAKPKKAKQNPEYKIQAAFVREMSRRYPKVMVFSDTAAHIGKTMFQQIRANELSTPGEKWPDVFIAQPSGDYCGLYLEFKAETPYKSDGATLKKNDHVEAQRDTMARLHNRGYYCDFVWSVEQAMKIVEWYFNLYSKFHAVRRLAGIAGKRQLAIWNEI